jgi:uncharacterized protein (DUF983 family)
VAEPRAGTIVARGFAARCGRCGSRGIFTGYFKLRERCPRCGYRFNREAGAFTGVMLMNITATFVLMFLSLVSYVLWRGVTGNDDLALWPFAVACFAWAAIVPLVFYPLALTIWSAIDLAMRPLDDEELADADAHRAAA